ncbi:hypothetical protein P171DRAFT_426747 [Karstenula rhodostoma CBS 690.94]|uniref:Uncharacterized protein n=1 Tax=Karstenula rhodostoma CBS 690.94 TaxID=1392251 RepID=A0A9P4PWS9_9PLEO|nr:hypothetical protein P171DRAFT_426747 [Karstenula rhodostoma CBS 690.94]
MKCAGPCSYYGVDADECLLYLRPPHKVADRPVYLRATPGRSANSVFTLPPTAVRLYSNSYTHTQKLDLHTWLRSKSILRTHQFTMSTSPRSPYGLPSSPRATRPGLSPLDTSFRSTPASYSDATPSPNEKSSPHSFTNTRPRRRDSLIFANATIPLSPPPSPPSAYKENPFEGVTPRRRNAFARFFCCLGREERARRRAAWADEFEQVGEKRHWTEV